MSYQCDIDIDPKQFTNHELIKLCAVLHKYRPTCTANIVNDTVVDLPYGFSDDYSGGMRDFAKDINGTFSYVFIDDESDEHHLEFIDGVLLDED